LSLHVHSTYKASEFTPFTVLKHFSRFHLKGGDIYTAVLSDENGPAGGKRTMNLQAGREKQ